MKLDQHHLIVLRGHSWGSVTDDCRSSFCYWAKPDHEDFILGFRIMKLHQTKPARGQSWINDHPLPVSTSDHVRMNYKAPVCGFRIKKTPCKPFIQHIGGTNV